MQQWSRKFNDYDALVDRSPGSSRSASPGSSPGGGDASTGAPAHTPSSSSSSSSSSKSGAATTPSAAPSSSSGDTQATAVGASPTPNGQPVWSGAQVNGHSNGVAANGVNGAAANGSTVNGHKTAISLHYLADHQKITNTNNGQQQTRDPSSVNGVPTSSSSRGGVLVHSRQEEQLEGPAPLRGVYEGDVDATMDEEAAAVLWGGSPAAREDPEYVI